MSTTTNSSTATSKVDECGDIPGLCIGAVIVVLLFLYLGLKYGHSVPVKNLTVAVESTAVRYYNVTPEGLVDSIIGVGIRAGNLDPNGPPLSLTGLNFLVKKGNQTIARGDLPSVFNLTAGSEVRVRGEAFGLVPLPEHDGRTYPDAKLADEVRADLAAGEGIIEVELINGSLGGEMLVGGTCKDVVIDCSGRSADRAQKVDCLLKGSPPY